MDIADLHVYIDAEGAAFYVRDELAGSSEDRERVLLDALAELGVTITHGVEFRVGQPGRYAADTLSQIEEYITRRSERLARATELRTRANNLLAEAEDLEREVNKLERGRARG